MQSVALLGLVHNLYARAIPLWLHLLKGATVESWRPQARTHDPWDVPECEVDGLPEEPSEQQPSAAAGADWTEWNLRQRSNSLRLCEGDGPGPAALMASVTLQPQVALMHGLLESASTDAFERTLIASARAQPRLPFLVEWQSGRLVTAFSEHVWARLTDPGHFDALPPHLRTRRYSSQATGMMLRAVGGVAQNMRHAQFPFRLFSVLGPTPAEAADDILQAPDCLRCAFSRKVLARYSSKDALLSPEFRALLLALSSICRVETSRIECRHASIRRVGRARSQTTAQQMSHVSADYVIAQQRILEQGQWHSKAQAEMPRARGRPSQKRRRINSGGGAQRLHVSRCLRGMRFTSRVQRSEAFKQANAGYKRLLEANAPELDDLRRIGELGKHARRAGGHAFGAPPSKLRRRGQERTICKVRFRARLSWRRSLILKFNRLPQLGVEGPTMPQPASIDSQLTDRSRWGFRSQLGPSYLACALTPISPISLEQKNGPISRMPCRRGLQRCRSMRSPWCPPRQPSRRASNAALSCSSGAPSTQSSAAWCQQTTRRP